MKDKIKKNKQPNWNINAQIKSENKILSDWVTRNYGPKCKKFVEGCVVCESWLLFDKLKLYEINEKNAMKLASESNADRAEVRKSMQTKEINDFVAKVKKFPDMFKYLKSKVK